MIQQFQQMFSMSTLASVGQILFLGLLIGGLIYYFKTPQKFKLIDLVYAAIFTVIPLILSGMISVYIPVGGVNAFKISFAQPIMAIGGSILATPLGYLVGILVDILGVIYFPAGTMYFGFTFNAAITYVIASLIYKKLSTKDQQTPKKMVLGILSSLLVVGNILILIIPKTLRLESFVFDLTQKTLGIANRYFLMLVFTIIVVVLMVIIHYLTQYLKQYNQKEIYIWILIVLSIEVVINIILTPLHLNLMYNLPYILLLLPRIIKALVLLPINVAICVFVDRAIKNWRKIND